MKTATIEHRSTVVLCADVVGYSRLMGIDEEGTLSALKSIRRRLVDPKISDHGGRIARTMGDGLIAEFTDDIDAVLCAIAIQSGIGQFDAEAPADRRIQLRIGINTGNVVTEGDGIYGDCVTAAAHLESLAEPGGLNVSRSVREHLADRLPVTYEDLGGHNVKNLAGEVGAFRVRWQREDANQARAAEKRSPAPPEKPGIAVLPFQCLAGDPEAEFFLDSLGEDLITALARSRWFSVIARNSSFRYKGSGASPAEIARELGVRYLLQGSLRKAGERVRISCQLVEAASGQQLWSERFDGTLEESFDLQDEVTLRVIGAVSPALRVAEIERARRAQGQSQSVYELTLRAIGPAFAETARENAEALRILGRALDIDHAAPSANALAAWCLQQRHLMNWPAAQGDDREAAKRLARKAIAEGADAPMALAVGATVRAALSRDHALALAATDRAVATSPDSALVLGFDALTRCLCGLHDAAIAHAERALLLSPYEPLAYIAALALALASWRIGRVEQAIKCAGGAIDGNRNFAFSYIPLALACGRLGRRAEAERAVQRMLDAAPGFRAGTLRRIRFADAGGLLSDLALLRAAGLPE